MNRELSYIKRSKYENVLISKTSVDRKKDDVRPYFK